jgi:hypothetical protein
MTPSIRLCIAGLAALVLSCHSAPTRRATLPALTAADTDASHGFEGGELVKIAVIRALSSAGLLKPVPAGLKSCCESTTLRISVREQGEPK